MLMAFEVVSKKENIIKAHALIEFLMPGSALSAAPIPVHKTGVDNSDVVEAPGLPISLWLIAAQSVRAGYLIGSTPFRYNCCY